MILWQGALLTFVGAIFYIIGYVPYQSVLSEGRLTPGEISPSQHHIGVMWTLDLSDEEHAALVTDYRYPCRTGALC